MTEHVHEWIPFTRTYGDGASFIEAKCGCGKRLHEPELKTRINATERLLHAIAHSPLYWVVKDTYTELRGIMEEMNADTLEGK